MWVLQAQQGQQVLQELQEQLLQVSPALLAQQVLTARFPDLLVKLALQVPYLPLLVPQDIQDPQGPQDLYLLLQAQLERWGLLGLHQQFRDPRGPRD